MQFVASQETYNLINVVTNLKGSKLSIFCTRKTIVSGLFLKINSPTVLYNVKCKNTI